MGFDRDTAVQTILGRGVRVLWEMLYLPDPGYSRQPVVRCAKQGPQIQGVRNRHGPL